MSQPLVAVDTNFLLDLALPREIAQDALEVIRDRIPNARIVALPTVLTELDYLCHDSPVAATRGLAKRAMESMVRDWKIHPKICTSLGRDLIESIGDAIRSQGIIPEEERNDSYLIAEAALADCDFLVSNDGHLKDSDKTKLFIILKERSVKPVVLCSPREIMRKFARR